ncbi:EAL domain-containing response regulator [Methylomonas rapida]|uniref:EAL domain-containing protein n=1 Tax=Methylomonas rapida TaxID=2963939 RepID=A0ABY7GGU8_9GAMM|nr:EAL domain-containing protein [Methylomonas rapida]WAR43023.1 EAL domain-containing protein [Methylomonas rapida]
MIEKKPKILVIDDTPANLALLGLALQDDYVVQIATSGAKGLELAGEDPPALILLDIMMPNMDGYDTCRHFKADPVLQHIPVVFVTALSEMNAEILGLSLGAADFLVKPFNIDIARLRIRNLLEREQLRQELQRKEAEQRLAASVFAHSHDGIVITDAENRIINVNAAFTRISGYQLEEVVGKNPAVLKSGRQSAEFYQAMWQALANGDHWSGEIWNRNKRGEVYAALTSISVVRDDQDHIHHYIGLFSDITRLKKQQHDLERIAHFDPLTGIPNRVLLNDRIQQALAHTRRAKKLLAVCYLDLDGFKPINDQFGHETGDQLLIDVTKRIKECLRASDTLARVGGDEFVLLISDINDVSECKSVLDRILIKVAQPGVIYGHGVAVSASLGFTFYPDDFNDAETLIRHADQAMYVAKQRGKNRHHLFDPQQDRIALARGESFARIEAAFAADQFVLHFQPKVNMRQGTLLGAEALIRWQDPKRGLIAPGEFLPEIEGTELELAIGNWVLATALEQLEHWRRQGLNIKLSINVAPCHLLHADFCQLLAVKFAEHPLLQPGCLELEIVETAALQDIERVSKIMDECQRLGVHFALDDFGTGYSSLTYLKALPAQVLKIDKSFVINMLDNSDDLAIVKGIIDLSTTFRRQLIAEGVETVEHGLRLLALGCENAQGFAIARAMSGTDLLDWIRNWVPDPAWLRT